MKLALKVLLFCGLAISGFMACIVLSSAQTSAVGDVVQLSERVYVDLRAADDVGANITVLADQYNTALRLIDQAQRLDDAGNHTGAALVAVRAEGILQPIRAEAEILRIDALARQQTARSDRLWEIPIEAFIVTLFVAGFMVVRRRIRFNQIMEMRVVAK